MHAPPAPERHMAEVTPRLSGCSADTRSVSDWKRCQRRGKSRGTDTSAKGVCLFAEATMEPLRSDLKWVPRWACQIRPTGWLLRLVGRARVRFRRQGETACGEIDTAATIDVVRGWRRTVISHSLSLSCGVDGGTSGIWRRYTVWTGTTRW
ncbi:uncharacterized protein M6B38_356645 [Iris pallida]|uniref:Uncharacterized protein n=1 Tax=Iris pallida TaxID=29817 RepID=A0AAX6GN16_IRIPA|nr:uncharacterized protein M6B38_356645 [Iris pallida]